MKVANAKSTGHRHVSDAASVSESWVPFTAAVPGRPLDGSDLVGPGFLWVLVWPEPGVGLQEFVLHPELVLYWEAARSTRPERRRRY